MTDGLRPGFDVALAFEARVPTLILGKNLFAGPARIQDEFVDFCVVTCLQTAGQTKQRFIGGGQHHRPGVAVRVRSARDFAAFDQAQALADTLVHAIDKQPPDGWCSANVDLSGVTYLGPTQRKLHEFGFNVSLIANADILTTYWGTGAAGGTGAAFVTALANSAESVNRFREFSITAGLGLKIYLSLPVAFEPAVGSTTFQVGALPGGFSLVDTPTISGVPYNLYESNQDNLGAVTVAVT